MCMWLFRETLKLVKCCYIEGWDGILWPEILINQDVVSTICTTMTFITAINQLTWVVWIVLILREIHPNNALFLLFHLCSEGGGIVVLILQRIVRERQTNISSKPHIVPGHSQQKMVKCVNGPYIWTESSRQSVCYPIVVVIINNSFLQLKCCIFVEFDFAQYLTGLQETEEWWESHVVSSNTVRDLTLRRFTSDFVIFTIYGEFSILSPIRRLPKFSGACLIPPGRGGERISCNTQSIPVFIIGFPHTKGRNERKGDHQQLQHHLNI